MLEYEAFVLAKFGHDHRNLVEHWYFPLQIKEEA